MLLSIDCQYLNYHTSKVPRADSTDTVEHDPKSLPKKLPRSAEGEAPGCVGFDVTEALGEPAVDGVVSLGGLAL